MNSEIERQLEIANEIYKAYVLSGDWPLENKFRIQFESYIDILDKALAAPGEFVRRTQDSLSRFKLCINTYRVNLLPAWKPFEKTWNELFVNIQGMYRERDGEKADGAITQKEIDIYGRVSLNIAFNAFCDLGIIESLGKDKEGNISVYTISPNVLGKKSIEDFFQAERQEQAAPLEKWVSVGVPFAGGGQGEVSYAIFGDFIRSPFSGVKWPEYVRITLAISKTIIGKSDFVYAMKKLKKPVSEQAQQRMQLEIETLQNLSHPNLVKIIDGNPKECWFVMEYFPKGTLTEKLAYYSQNSFIALTDFIGLVEGVAQLHAKRIIHRDIKPGNIFIGNEGSLVLGDFGLVFNLDNKERLTKMDESTGTDFFMPPWAYGKRLEEITPAFDVYSLGKVLWCMLSGKRKITSHSYGDLPSDSINQYPAVERILTKCCPKEEKDCSMTASDLLVEVKGILSRINSRLLSDN